MHSQDTKASGVCEHCGETFYRRFPSYVGRFCSTRCANSHHTRPSAENRFWALVDKDGPVLNDELGACWTVSSGLSHGYGHFMVDGVVIPTHVYSWELANGPVPKGMEVCHKCDNPPCARPDHLFLGTQLDNMCDAVAKDRIARGDRHYRRKHRSPDGTYKAPERPSHGEKNGQAILTAAQVIEIRALYAAGGITQAKLAQQFGIDQTNISLIVNGKKWRHLL